MVSGGVGYYESLPPNKKREKSRYSSLNSEKEGLVAVTAG
jgi:hypothetical protein